MNVGQPVIMQAANSSGVLMALRCYIAGQTFEEMGIIRYKTKNAEVVEIFADDVKDAIERFQKGE